MRKNSYFPYLLRRRKRGSRFPSTTCERQRARCHIGPSPAWLKAGNTSQSIFPSMPALSLVRLVSIVTSRDRMSRIIVVPDRALPRPRFICISASVFIPYLILLCDDSLMAWERMSFLIHIIMYFLQSWKSSLIFYWVTCNLLIINKIVYFIIFLFCNHFVRIRIYKMLRIALRFKNAFILFKSL